MEAVSLRISESTATQFSSMIYEATGLFALSNPCVTRGNSFVNDFEGRRGCLRCQIHASPLEAVFVDDF
jgi:hypothetical protein